MLPEDNGMLWSAIQGVYYILTGVWPIIHYRSFEKVTGPKTDIWLVKTVGALAASIGIALFVLPFTLLAVCSALSFLCVDIIYVSKKVISRIYLLDAVIQVIFLWMSSRAILFTY